MTRTLMRTVSSLALGLMVGTANQARADAMHDAAVWEFYLGAHAGLGMLDGKIDLGANGQKIKHGNRGVFGVLAGINFRQGYWLFGLEGDIGFSSRSRLKGVFCEFGFSCKVSMNYHVRGRLGRMVTPNIDVFTAAGMALLDLEFGLGGQNYKKTLTGLSLGAGADVKLGQIDGGLNPILRLEALYDMYGKKNLGSGYTAKNWDDFTVRAAAMFAF